ncbi:hypothetical protein [Longimicrobium terrae]|uniref:Uncharacterized protein n=1 Tax=Longimicrobium terrae TaxID=1639882 RepID=A0A841H5C7_9BACT|nr:hypothetical protein [Longimicrobium terrae]MBB4638939.1 hypothetical protein [Longimicrobium terrae]MBB6073178.1 hypothetical protein [Longimicrobium terrae]NNC32366.1 hypothetical protein [Longimicrobium terrae]
MTEKESVRHRLNQPLSEHGSIVFGMVACFAAAFAGLIDVLLGDPYPHWQAAFLVPAAAFGIVLIRLRPRRPDLADLNSENR